MLLEIACVGRSLQKPQQLVDDRLSVQLFRRHEREALAQVEAHLGPKKAERPGARPVFFTKPLMAHLGQKIEILAQDQCVPIFLPVRNAETHMPGSLLRR